jgi:hypothetical protein
VNDDELHLIDNAVDFLQGEFSPVEGDPVWSVEYFQWKLGTRNPAGAGYISLAMLDGNVVGVVSLTKKRVWFNGQQLIGGEVGDAYTSARVRRGVQPHSLSAVDADPASFINRSIFGRLAAEVRERAEAEGVKIIYGTPNANAYPGWTKRLGYFNFQDYDNRSFTRPTWRMLIKRYPTFYPAHPIIRFCENTLVAVHAALCRFRNDSLVLALQPINEIQIELDELWVRVKPDTGFSLVRDSAYWVHRYIDHPLAKYSIFSIRRHGFLVGIAAIRLASITNRKPVLSIVEWMLEDNIPFDFLLSQIIDACKHWEIDSFNFWAESNGKEAKASRYSLFVKRGRIPIIFAKTPVGNEICTMKNAFHFNLGSTDAA